MPIQSKSLWVVVGLVAAGAIILVLSTKQNTSSSKVVEMTEIFDQKPATMAAQRVSDGDPVPSPAIVTSPEHGKEAGFSVQVYSFKDQTKADVALANLKKSGYPHSYVEISDLGAKGTFYRVRIGGLENEAQAQALLETIRKSFNSGIIIKPQTQNAVSKSSS